MAKFVRLPIFDEDGVMLKEVLELDISLFFNTQSARVIKLETEDGKCQN